MAKGGTDEIDTIFEADEGKPAANAAEQVKSLSAEISLGSQLESSKSELNEAAALPEKTFFFSDFPRQVYCTLSGIGFVSFKPARAGASLTSPSRRLAAADVATSPAVPIGCSTARYMTVTTRRSATSILVRGTTSAGTVSSSSVPTSAGSSARSTPSSMRSG